MNSCFRAKTEPKSLSSKPVKSALNSVISEKNKIARPDKHDKMKNGKPVKSEKKVDKKSDGVKKHDSMHKEKKPASGKVVKRPVESDDDEPLVRVKYTDIHADDFLVVASSSRTNKIQYYVHVM